ncbi:hypothetical protein [Bacillus sp. AFS040349]|uniref:hypothetical protein n=1 Tax=Bacillus sp. AFS040349 TaxID=2033502 RepID=UPI000BFBF92C|nr:hypothetical protein [Bacillus sp. AFS040349]PGT81582.1 hypothetical protein COD11_17325 [Bacillus sp. AFS040349]
MSKLITVNKAEKEIKRLQHFVALVENYEANTLDKWIIKEYAYTNSVREVVSRADRKGMDIDQEYAKSVIKGKPNDELHKILKSGYMARIKPNQKKY